MVEPKSRPVRPRSRSCDLEPSPSPSSQRRVSRWGSSHTTSSLSPSMCPVAVAIPAPHRCPCAPVARDEEGGRATGRDEEEVKMERRKEHSSHRRTPTCVHRLEPPLVGGRPLPWRKAAVVEERRVPVHHRGARSCHSPLWKKAVLLCR
jgi:hypothetical protein